VPVPFYLDNQLERVFNGNQLHILSCIKDSSEARGSYLMASGEASRDGRYCYGIRITGII